MPIEYVRNGFPRTQHEHKGLKWAVLRGKTSVFPVK